jgi:hypothetical protein
MLADMEYPGGQESSSSSESTTRAIEAQGGISAWKGVYRHGYLRPTTVDGNSFTQIEGTWFEDSKFIYVAQSNGLLPVEGVIPGMTTRVGALDCNNGRIFWSWQHELVRCKIDLASFRHVGGRFYADKDHVYLLRPEQEGGYPADLYIFEGVDLASFRHVGDDFYADKDHVYLLRPEQEGGDPADLSIFEEADVASFEFMRDLYCDDPDNGFTSISCDDKHVWVNGKPVAGLTRDAVRFVGSAFWIGGSCVYCGRKPMPDADPETFTVLSEKSCYARSGEAIYYLTHPVAGADAASFVADDAYRGHDRHRRYIFASVDKRW